MTSQLFQPIELAGLTMPNRTVIAPMCQYSAEEGSATDWHMLHLGSLAMSGAGLLILEATAVEPEGRITAADLGLYSDANEAALKRVIDGIRKYSTMPIGIQLGHAGRKASSAAPWDGGQQVTSADGGWVTSAPSAIGVKPEDERPVALDSAGLARVLDAFVATAQRALRLGIQAFEIHAAHGYLLHQFLSPLSNQRNDEYGGPLANRLRFPLEVFDAVRAVVPAGIPVGVRVSATDWVDHGWDLEQTVAFAHALKERGCDFMDVSSGGISPAQQIPLAPGYQVGFAERVKAETGMPTMAVGLITEASHAESIVVEGKADMVALARGILYDPHWPWHAAAELGASVAAPKQYWRSQPRGQANLFGETRLGQR
ncbi:NADH:flavin oxidoreductase/NADH oxidase [Acidisphaera sp. L21]|uniref:NADH:flavin oxidoreductase/NADH oxidase n=1 Tax=Acidisphaera sp. L21 TaxID=1641851 RepID=UPI00131E1607|nr:NADH:flavin oxidoreductase/NADH oxidase [Acidisphaera sp. L21]